MPRIILFMILVCAFTAKAQTTKPPVSLLGTWLIAVGVPSDNDTTDSHRSTHGKTWRIHKYDSKTNLLSLTEMVLYPGTKRAVPVKREIKAKFSAATLTLELGDTWNNQVITLELVNTEKDSGLSYRTARPKDINQKSVFAIMSRLDTDTSELKPFLPEGDVEISIGPPPPIKETKPE